MPKNVLLGALVDTTFVTEHPFQASQSVCRPCYLAARVSFSKKGHSRRPELCKSGPGGELESLARTEKAVIRSWQVPCTHFLSTSRLLHLCALPADRPPGPYGALSSTRLLTQFPPDGLLWHIPRKCVTPPAAKPASQAPPGRISPPAFLRTSTQTALCGTFCGSA